MKIGKRQDAPIKPLNTHIHTHAADAVTAARSSDVGDASEACQVLARTKIGLSGGQEHIARIACKTESRHAASAGAL